MLTPNKLLDNLNNNFGKVVNEALVGYYTCWKAEKDITDIINVLKDLKTINTDELYIFGETISHGKSFFASEVIKHLTEMDNLKTYVNIILSHNTVPRGDDTRGDDIGPIGNDTRGEDIGQTGGLPGFYRIFALIAGLTMNTYDNAAALALEMSITPPEHDIVIYSEVGGEFPRARPSFTGSLDPTNPEQMEEFTKQYSTDQIAPDNTSQSINMNELFKDDFVKKLNMDIITSYFTPESQLSSQFSAAVEGKVKQVNKIIEDVHTSLETMCEKFVQVRDPQLPIRLFEFFNEEYDRNQQKVEQEVTAMVENTREKLRSDKLAKININQPEPGMIEKFSQLGNMFIFGSNNEKSTDSLSTNQLIEVYDRVDADVSRNLEEVKPLIMEQATKKVFGDAMKEFADTVQDSTDKSNLIVYFSEVCTIQKPRYSYDKKTGILKIINPARSRFHLTVLVRNVIAYNERVRTKSVSTDRETNLQSLYEKALTIQQVLNQYDGNMKNHLTEGTEMANGELDEFFQFLINTWTNLKEPIKQATQNFPVTNQREELERSRSTEEFINAMKQKGFEDEQSIALKMKELELKRIENELSSEELEIWDKYVQLKINLVLNPIKGTVNNLLNATTDIVLTGTEGVGRVFDSGVNSVTRSVYSIAWAGMALIIPLMLGSCILGCGPCGTFLAFIIPNKKLRQNTSGKSDEPPPPPPAEQREPPTPPAKGLNQGFSSYSSHQPSFGSLSNNSKNNVGFLPSNMFLSSNSNMFLSSNFTKYRDTASRYDSSDDEADSTVSGRKGGQNGMKRKPKKTRRNKKKAKQTKKYKSNNKKKHTKVRKHRYTKKH